MGGRVAGATPPPRDDRDGRDDVDRGIDKAQLAAWQQVLECLQVPGRHGQYQPGGARRESLTQHHQDAEHTHHCGVRKRLEDREQMGCSEEWDAKSADEGVTQDVAHARQKEQQQQGAAQCETKPLPYDL